MSDDLFSGVIGFGLYIILFILFSSFVYRGDHLFYVNYPIPSNCIPLTHPDLGAFHVFSLIGVVYGATSMAYVFSTNLAPILIHLQPLNRGETSPV